MPTSGVIVRRSGRYRTVYKVLKSYRNIHGTPTQKRVTIGRLDDETNMLVPNETYWEFYGDRGQVVITQTEDHNDGRGGGSDRLAVHFGATLLVDTVLDDLGVYRILEDVFGAKDAQLIRDCATAMTVRQSNVMHTIGDWLDLYKLGGSGLNSQTASQLFTRITHDKRMEFFTAWNKIANPTGYLAYDVTSMSTYAHAIADAEYGYNRDGESLPQINLAQYVCYDTSLPVFYVTYPGSIVDKSHLTYMQAYNADLGLDTQAITFVLDQGFCSTKNFTGMYKAKQKFIACASTAHKATRTLIHDLRDELAHIKHRLEPGVYGMSKTGTYYGAYGTMHIFRNTTDDAAAMVERKVTAEHATLTGLTNPTQAQLKKYTKFHTVTVNPDGTLEITQDWDKTEEAVFQASHFAIMTTDNTLTTKEVLTLYRQKDIIEKTFDGLKNHLDFHRLHTHHTETTDGKLFCAFIGLIALQRIRTTLADYQAKHSTSISRIFSELNKLTLITPTTGPRQQNPLTKTHKDILTPFNITQDTITQKITNTQP